ncbi:hypothetical protein FRX31_010385 [Thalictrum thalictroides]|uniref:Uncharacterized protein n=1 Tax=Thalictrum thalictroides TaxID=46969 RepID=A0A7J6WTQ1_THATH|nr:hypothetical protein FRX31_010385 [Thalictrum thalictroides]
MEMMKEEKETSVEGSSTDMGSRAKKRGRPKKLVKQEKVEKKNGMLDIIDEAEVESPLDKKEEEVTDPSPVFVKRPRNRRKGIPSRSAR